MIMVFFQRADGTNGHWTIQKERLSHTLEVMAAKGFIVTGYENII